MNKKLLIFSMKFLCKNINPRYRLTAKIDFGVYYEYLRISIYILFKMNMLGFGNRYCG